MWQSEICSVAAGPVQLNEKQHQCAHPRMAYQHALLDFVPQAWTVLDTVRNSSKKLGKLN